jgi:hypothetical protein
LPDIVESDGDSLEYVHLIRLAQNKRAISNFVNILTQRNIPVYFNTKDKNVTDGEVIYLSPKLQTRKDFDVAVGLSLHEAAHIVESDFTILKTLWQRTPRKLYDAAIKHNIDKSNIVKFLKTMLNYVEDRYIDSMIYRDAPGYRGYYIALYENYFNSPINSVALKSNVYRFPSIAAYEFRILNFTHPDSDLSALPELDVIYKLIDLPNILRLKTPNDRFLIAVEMCEIVLKNIGKEDSKKKSSDSQDQSNKNGKSDEIAKSGENGEKGAGAGEENGESSDEPAAADGEKTKEPDGSDDVLGGSQAESTVSSEDNASSDPNDLETGKGDVSGINEDKLDKAIKKQKDFVNGTLRLPVLNDKDATTVSSIENSGMSLIRVGKSLTGEGNGLDGIECVVVKKLTDELLNDPSFPMYTMNLPVFNINSNPNEAAVSDGLVLGRLLGKKLQIRDEERITKYNRQRCGKIDRRILSEIGHDYYNIFYTVKSDKFNKISLHISVDASASMAGKKWRKTVTSVVAICKAASMTTNIKTSVSLRTSIVTKSSGTLPYIVIAYDSTKDSIITLAERFRKLSPNHTTPEGLAFEAIMDSIPNKLNMDEDHYFLNFSDGEPCFSTVVSDTPFLYTKEPAVEHTRKQVLKIKQKGYRVLSYFIEDESNHRPDLKTNFERMYGKNAAFVDVNNITKIANTLNAMFLEKD